MLRGCTSTGNRTATRETENAEDPACKLQGQCQETAQRLASASMKAETEKRHWEESWVIREKKTNMNFKKQH